MSNDRERADERDIEAESDLNAPLGIDWLERHGRGTVLSAGGAGGPPELLLLGSAFLAGLVAVWTIGQRRRRSGQPV